MAESRLGNGRGGRDWRNCERSTSAFQARRAIAVLWHAAIPRSSYSAVLQLLEYHVCQCALDLLVLLVHLGGVGLGEAFRIAPYAAREVRATLLHFQPEPSELILREISVVADTTLRRADRLDPRGRLLASFVQRLGKQDDHSVPVRAVLAPAANALGARHRTLPGIDGDAQRGRHFRLGQQCAGVGGRRGSRRR